MSWRIYLSPPHLGAEERELLLDAFDSNWVAPLGPHVDALEEELAATVGAEHAVALSSGTAGLHLALLEAGVQRGDEVLCPTLTFAATANAIRYCGADPVFVDTEEGSWNLDPALLADELDRMTRVGAPPAAIVTVDLYGTPCDHDAILKVAADHDVPVIEDAAEALGATYGDEPVGTFGMAGVFSFNGNKIITSGGGGALVTDDAEVAGHVRHLATQAREPAPHYQHEEIGYNYRLSNLLAAVARGQLRHLDERVATRRAINLRYRTLLDDLDGISVHPTMPGSICWLTSILVDVDTAGVDREQIRTRLVDAGIEARPVWKPMHLQPVFADCRTVGGDVAAGIFQDGLCLPSGSSLTDGQVDEIAAIVQDTVADANLT